MQNEKIHPSAKIHPTAIIYDDVIINENVSIGPFCVIGGPVELSGVFQDGKGLIIESGTRIENACIIQSGFNGLITKIGKNCIIMSNAYIGGNATLNDDVVLCPFAKIGQFVWLGKGVFVGINSLVFTQNVGHYCRISSQSFLVGGEAVPSGGVYQGNPAIYIGKNEINGTKFGLKDQDFNDLQKTEKFN